VTTRSLWLATLCALAAGALFGWLVRSDALLSLLTQALIHAVLAVGVGVLLRQNGMVSFGHALFFGVSGYGVGILMRAKLMPAEARDRAHPCDGGGGRLSGGAGDRARARRGVRHAHPGHRADVLPERLALARADRRRRRPEHRVAGATLRHAPFAAAQAGRDVLPVLERARGGAVPAGAAAAGPLRQRDRGRARQRGARALHRHPHLDAARDGVRAVGTRERAGGCAVGAEHRLRLARRRCTGACPAWP
jgi:hypothetical protein